MRRLYLLLQLLFLAAHCQEQVDLLHGLQTMAKASCPGLVPQVFMSHVPRGGIDNTTMNYTKAMAGSEMDCVDKCCSNGNCQVAFMFKNNTSLDCFMLSCATDDLCLPKDVADKPKYRNHASMVLIKPRNPPWNVSRKVEEAESSVCEVGMEKVQCKQNETCVPQQDKSRNGVCRCSAGFILDATTKKCIAPVPVTTPSPKTITVSVASKTITLPENSAHLAAYSVPQETSENPYKYQWRMVSGASSGTEADSATATLKLSALEEGVYQFKVTVSSGSPVSYGEAFANVTVLPKKRINQPPIAVVTPVEQTVNLPTNKAIIDGSTSTDDNGDIASFSWEIVTSPMGYESKMKQEPTLSLDNLIAGNYTLTLTVTDSDGATNKATAYIIVVKENDYPPNANAGEDIIINIPQNVVILNGNKSLDDHAITTWEWTKEKTSDGSELPADIVGARTPYLKVSNLEQGVYNFVLRVTDTAGQSAEDRVSVYVKPPSNLPPAANAGPDQTLSLPVAFVTLDGSSSKDDVSVASLNWTLVSGPGKAIIQHPTKLVTNVTDLTVGAYTFKLTVTDGNKNSNADTVLVTVKQDTNVAPVARAGGDRKVSLPVGVVRVDGRGSSDDLKVERWEWSWDQASLAAGTMVANSSQTEVLMLSDLVPGRYVFNLKVWDVQGKSSCDSVSIIVEQDPDLLSVVEVILDVDISQVTYKQVTQVLETIRVLIHGESEMTVLKEKFYGTANSGLSTLRFKVLMDSVPLAGREVVQQLSRELLADSDLLGLGVVRVQTVVCQNDCSGHGECVQNTRECRCQPFWMENTLARHLLGKEPNCDWSVIYVCLGFGIFCLVVLSTCCFVSCRKKTKRLKTPKRYSRLDTNDSDMEMNEDEFQTSLMKTESDSEEEILFESSKKGRRLNGSLPNLPRPFNAKNGILRNGKKSSSKVKEHI